MINHHHHHHHRCRCCCCFPRLWLVLIDCCLPHAGFPIGTLVQFQRDHSAHVLLVQIERPQQDRVFQRHENERALFLR